MKYKIFLFSLLAACTGYSTGLDVLVAQNQKAAAPVFPAAVKFVREFKLAQPLALRGDAEAQKKIPELLIRQFELVYSRMARQGGLLFSVRRPVKGFEAAENNYAVNLAGLLEDTAEQVKVSKKDFSVQSKDGAVYSVLYPKYKPSEQAIEVKSDAGARWLPLADLKPSDRLFVQNALADESFASTSDFSISIADHRSDGTSGEGKKISAMHEDTLETVEGSFVQRSTKQVGRKIVLENNGPFALENLVIEYQSFITQVLMGLPQDFPKDYRHAGFLLVKSLAPGEKKTIALELPETVTADLKTIITSQHEYSMIMDADKNQKSEGRINGIWVKVHRFTPYGECLTRETKTGGVPSVEWCNVAPVSADIRK